MVDGFFVFESDLSFCWMDVKINSLWIDNKKEEEKLLLNFLKSNYSDFYSDCDDIINIIRFFMAKKGKKRAIISKPKIVSLFSGCGGLDLAFHNEGYDTGL